MNLNFGMLKMSAWLLSRTKHTVTARQLLCLCKCVSHSNGSTDRYGGTRSWSTGCSSRTFNNKKKVLNISSTVLQNRNGTNELPLIVRYVGTGNYGNKCNDVISEERKALGEKLHSCTNMQQVLKLLQIPCDGGISGHAATSALLKLVHLESSDILTKNAALKLSLNKAIMEELFQVVAVDLKKVKNEDLIGLVKGYIEAMDYADPVLCLAKIRMADGHFTFAEVLSLSKIFAREIQKPTLKNEDCVSLLFKGWEHMIKYDKSDITTSHIGMILEEFPVQMKSQILRLLMQHIKGFDPLLRRNAPVFEDLAKCFVELIDKFEPSDLSDLTALYQSFGYCYLPLFSALEKYVVAEPARIDTPLLSQILKMFREFRYFSSEVMDTAAVIFMNKGFLFSVEELYNILIVFGHFDYMPDEGRTFLFHAEMNLLNKINSFQADDFLELLLSFHHLNCNLSNFNNLIFSMDFAKKLHDLSPEKKPRAFFNWKRLCIQQNYDGGNLIDHFKRIPESVRQYKNMGVKLEARLRYSLMRSLDVDEDFLWRNMYFNIPFNTVWCEWIFAYEYNETGIQFLRFLEGSSNSERVVVLLVYPEDMCINEKSLLGEKAYTIQYCQNSGCRVILLLTEQLKVKGDVWTKILQTELSDIRELIKKSKLGNQDWTFKDG